MTAVASSEHLLADDPRALEPIAPADRIAVLDILRGFALFGICIINIPGFYSPFFFEAAGDELYPSRVDQAAEWLVDFLGSGKFNSMFSFLFGVGFAIQMDRAEAKGVPFVGTYLRRLLALFLFGVAHCFLIWNGDVLHIYAILGVGLLFVRKLSDRWLWGIAALLLLSPIGWQLVKYAKQEPNPHPPAYYRERAENQLRVFGKGNYDELLARMSKSAPAEPRPVVGEGSYVATVKERFRETKEGYLEHGEAWFWTIMGTTLMIGFIVGRHRVFQNLQANLPEIRRIAAWTGVIGISLALTYATVSYLAPHGEQRPTLFGTLAGVFYNLNRPVLCAFYVSGIILLAQKPFWRRMMAPLASVGRMPLTNYIMESVIHAALFYGWGFGLFGRVGPAQGVLIAIGTYCFQVLYSNLWMSRFRYGPLEWLWRTITYGKPPAILADDSRPVASAA